MADGGIGSVGGGFDTQTCTAFASVLVQKNPGEDQEKNVACLEILHQSLRRRLLTDAVSGIETKEDAKEVVENVQDGVVEDVIAGLLNRSVKARDITTEITKLRVAGLLQFITIYPELKKNKRFAVFLDEPDTGSESRLWKVSRLYSSTGVSSQVSRAMVSEKPDIWARSKSLLSSGRTTAQTAAEIYLGHTQATEKSDYPRVIVVDIERKLQPFGEPYAKQKEERERLQRKQAQAKEMQKERELKAKWLKKERLAKEQKEDQKRLQQEERLSKEQKAQKDREQRARAQVLELENGAQDEASFGVEGLESPTCLGRVFKVLELLHFAAG